MRYGTGVVLSSVAGVFEENSGKFGQSCSVLVGLGCASVVVVVVGECFGVVPYMCGCISRHTRWVNRLVRVRSWSCWKSGAVGLGVVCCR